MNRFALLLLSLALSVGWLSAPAQNSDELRDLFFAANTEFGVAVFAKTASIQNLSLPLNLAYSGVSTAMQAGYASGPWNKLDLFTEGKKALEHAIALDPLNAEIRFLRFSVQSSIPALLMYSGDMNKDLTLIEEYLNTTIALDSGFWRKALNVMLIAENTSESQRNKIRAMLLRIS